MSVKLGNNNKIDDSIIGDNNSQGGSNSSGIVKDIVVGLIVTIAGGLILSFILSLF